MMSLIIVFAVLALVVTVVSNRNTRQRREAFLAEYAFPSGIAERVRKRYPHLTPEQMDLVFDALREFFHLCRMSGRCMVSMPSQAVDAAWHEFILFTRNYDLFCRQGLGRFLHHTPAEAMATPIQAQEGIKRAWRLACFREGINPKTPERLPLLFALDAQLNIPDGFRYALNCRESADSAPADTVSMIYCGSDIGCTGGCSGDSGDGSGGDGGSGDGGSCGGGCGGGGD